MKEYEITLYVPQDNKPVQDDGHWLDTGCAFAMGAIVMLLMI